ncbi:hypothetical protein ACFQ0O_13820 [Saccharopolyspora spinosporotrichia]
MGSDAERRLRVAVLGPLRAWRGDELLDLGTVRQQAFLAALVLRPDVTVSRRELLDGVWGRAARYGDQGRARLRRSTGFASACGAMGRTQP